MTREEARFLAQGVTDNLPAEMRLRLKAVDVCPKLHGGMLTIRVYMINKTADEPEAFTFLQEEI